MQGGLLFLAGRLNMFLQFCTPGGWEAKQAMLSPMFCLAIITLLQNCLSVFRERKGKFRFTMPITIRAVLLPVTATDFIALHTLTFLFIRNMNSAMVLAIPVLLTAI